MYNEDEIISKWNAQMYDENETETDDVEYALSVIGSTPKRILEIACGSGRFLIPMAKAGHDVTGLDFDKNMLDKIAYKSTDTANMHYRMSDVIHDDWGTEYEVVLLAANFLLNIVSDMDYSKAQELVIRKAYAALTNGGHLLIDYSHTFYPEYWFNNPNPKVIWEGTDKEGVFGRMSLLDNIYDKESGIASFLRRYEITLPDKSSFTKDVPGKKHFPTLTQVKEWLNNAGFVIENEWGDYMGNPISDQTNRAIIWAKRQ